MAGMIARWATFTSQSTKRGRRPGPQRIASSHARSRDRGTAVCAAAARTHEDRFGCRSDEEAHQGLEPWTP